jgi:hypothetical protein
VYQQTHANIGKYAGNMGEPYINPNIPMYVPRDGENCIRIVDPIELLQLKIYFMDVFFHRNVGFKKDYFLCRNRHNLGPCPICEIPDEHMWDTNKDQAKTYLPDWRRLMWVLDLKNPQESGKLKLWSAPRTLSDEILAQSRSPENDTFIEVSDPFTGVPVYFTKTGKGLNTKYTGVKLGTQQMPLGEEVAAQRFQFMDVLIVPTYEKVHSSFHMQQSAPEAGEQVNVPHKVDSAYENQAATPPAHEIGAAEAAKLAREAEVESPNSETLEYDYSDLDLVQADNRECFRVNFNEYNECDTCVDREKCSLPWPKKEMKSAKTAKSSKAKTTKPSKAAAGTAGPGNQVVNQNPNTTSSPSVDNSQNILSAQEKLKAEIARRKAQG